MKTFEELVEANKFDWKYISNSYKSLKPKKTGKVELWHPDKTTTNQEFIDYCGANNLRPATFNEALEFALNNPDEQRKYPLATYDASQLCYLYLSGSGRGRDLHVYRNYPVSRWREDVRFLVVRESLDSETLSPSVPLDTWPLEILEINGFKYKLIKE